MSRTFTEKELQAILADHVRWLRGEYGGNRADLSGAGLYGANLYGAGLCGANLSRANLSGADLSRANLYGANLYGAKNVVVRCAVLPEEGEFICYKRVRGGVVLTLLVPEYASRVTPYSDRKSRVSHAIPIRAERDGRPCGGDVFDSIHDPSFKYALGQLAEVKDFDGSQDQVCTKGIHVYISKAEAREHQ